MNGCRDRAPARIVFNADTVTINTRFPSATGAHALTSAGDTLPVRSVTYRTVRDAAIEVDSVGQVTCRRSGDALLTASAGNATGQLVVHCRLVGALQMELFGLGLPLGGPGQPIAVAAYDEQKRPMGSVRVGIIVDDTNVVRLEGGILKPVSFGRTFVVADAGADARGGMQVTVYEPILDGQPITLASGASNSWKLRSGLYTLDLRLTSPDSASRVGVSWRGTYCGNKQAPLQGQLICLVRPEADNPTLSIAAPDAPVTGSISLSRSKEP